MTDTPRTDEAFATCCALTVLTCSNELEIENAKLKARIAELTELEVRVRKRCHNAHPDWAPEIRELLSKPESAEVLPPTNCSPPCDCGNPNAYWDGDPVGRREYGCVKCHEYNAGLDTAYRLAQEVVGSTMEGATLLCGIASSKKPLKANAEIAGDSPAD